MVAPPKIFILLFCIATIQFNILMGQCASKAGSNLNSCQLFQPWTTKEGDPELVSASNKYNGPLGSRIGATNIFSGFFRTKTQVSHPPGSLVFPSRGDLAGALDTFLKSIENENYFLVYFTRIHLIVLHQLYLYLTKIYATLNLTHYENLTDYLSKESTEALNKKTLIITHLINIIEAQANNAILERFPNIPKHVATQTGPLLMKHDYGADLNLLIDKQENAIFDDPGIRQAFKDRRNSYLKIYGQYLRLFNIYTQALHETDTEHANLFARLAQQVYSVMEQQRPILRQTDDIKQKINALRNLKHFNPPIFFYNDQTFRAMKLIPELARLMPQNSLRIPWPQTLIKDAKSAAPIRDKWGNIISAQPRAYFETNDGIKTRSESQAAKLYLNIPTLGHTFTQEVIPQPVWLNTQEGIMLMTRICFGDYASLFDNIFAQEEILDPCLSCITAKAAISAGLVSETGRIKQLCESCETFLAELRKTVELLAAQHEPIDKMPPIPSSLPDIPPPLGS